MHSSRVMSYRRYTNGDQSYWCTFTLATPPMQRTFHSNYFSISYELFRIVSEKVPQHCPYEKDFCLMRNGKVEQGQWIISWYDEHCIPNQTSKIWINEKIKVYSLRMIFVLLSFQRWVLRRKFVPSTHFSCRFNAEILNVRKFASMSIIVSPYLTWTKQAQGCYLTGTFAGDYSSPERVKIWPNEFPALLELILVEYLEKQINLVRLTLINFGPATF